MMMKFNKLLVSVIAIVFVVILATSAIAAPKIMKIGFTANRNTAQAKAMYKFAELVEKATNGSIKGEVFPESQLGGIREMIEAVQMNVAQVYFGGAGDYAPFSPRFNLIEMHMLVPHDNFMDFDASDTIFNSPVAQDILRDLEKINLKGLSYWDNDYKHMLNGTRPVRNLEDLNGLKIRTVENAAQVDALKVWSVLPVVIPFTEVYTSLQQGLIDGLEQQLGNIVKNNFHQAAKYLSLTGFLYLKAPVTISKIFYDSLTDDEQKAIEQAAQEGAIYARQLLIEEVKECIELLRADKNVEIVETIDPAEIIKMRKLLRPVYDEYVQKYDPEGGVAFMKVVDEAWAEWEKQHIK
jgi:tripartite ATP-independent transporter DctP family solute receptor